MPNPTQLPGWVDQSTSPVRAPVNPPIGSQQATPINPPINPTPSSVGTGQSGGFGQPNINRNAWDGLGTDTNANSPNATNQLQSQSGTDAAGVSLVGSPMSANQANLSPQIQQVIAMFQAMYGGGSSPQFQQVQGNPFNSGSNLNTWGQNTNNGIYGGT